LTGILKEEKIIVRDEKEGNRIYNKGYFGRPLSGSGVELELFEGLYLMESDRLEVMTEEGDEVKSEDLIERISEDEFHREYLPYKDMRNRGYVLKKGSGPASFRVFPRGGGPGKTPSKYWLCAYRENDSFQIDKIIDDLEKIGNLDKTMMAALVDEEGDVTYYIFSTIDLKGTVKNHSEKKIDGYLYGEGTILNKDFEQLHDQNFYGFEEEGTLRLSIYETLFLVEKEILAVEDINTGEELSVEDIKPIYRSKRGEFGTEYKVYKDLRERGLIPKTGFKYGAPFRAYSADPEEKHAEFIIQPVKKDYGCRWYKVSRAIRVAHSVRKDFLYAMVKNNDVYYMKIKRETP